MTGGIIAPVQLGVKPGFCRNSSFMRDAEAWMWLNASASLQMVSREYSPGKMLSFQAGCGDTLHKVPLGKDKEEQHR
jgi:hypothetical protein